MVTSSTPHQRAFACGTYTITAQVGVSLVSLFNSLFKQSRLHCLDVSLTWSRLHYLGVWSRLDCLGVCLTWYLWHLFLFWFLYTCAYTVVCMYYCVCVIFWGWSVYSLSRMGVYWTDEWNRLGARPENQTKSETCEYLTVVVEYRNTDIRQPQLSS